jgi:hypothetical protein
MKLTRRKLTLALVSSAASAQAQAQTTPQQTPDELLKIAQGRLRTNAEALKTVIVPISTEPAFQFRA